MRLPQDPHPSLFHCFPTSLVVQGSWLGRDTEARVQALRERLHEVAAVVADHAVTGAGPLGLHPLHDRDHLLVRQARGPEADRARVPAQAVVGHPVRGR